MVKPALEQSNGRVNHCVHLRISHIQPYFSDIQPYFSDIQPYSAIYSHVEPVYSHVEPVYSHVEPVHEPAARSQMRNATPGAACCGVAGGIWDRPRGGLDEGFSWVGPWQYQSGPWVGITPGTPLYYPGYTSPLHPYMPVPALQQRA